jgi:hypothetical protein
MKEVSPAMRTWILALIITYIFLGLLSMFAQGFLGTLYGTEPFEPGFIRVGGAYALGLAFMLYRAYSIETVKPMIETILVTSLLLIFAGVFNWFAVGVYSTQAYLMWFISLILIVAVTATLYLKQR